MMKRLALGVLSATFVLATCPVVVPPAAAADSNGKDCGWYNENGKIVFKGTCPHDSSDGTTGEPQPGCLSLQLPAGTQLAFRLLLATPCA